jgi:MFS transporter, ACDE family, multidrug resistance protein
MSGVRWKPGSTRLWAVYAGGFLGPFGGTMVTPMLPQLRRALHTSLGTAAWSITGYQIAFAASMVMSGTLAERWGRRRTIRAAYVLYPLASLVCAVAASTPAFLFGRVLQGVANAFISPLLLASLWDAVPRSRLGPALGIFASMQAAGQAFAPLIGGLLTVIDYRLAFLVSMLAAAGLSLAPLPSTCDQTVAAARPAFPARWRALLNRRLAIAGLVSFGLYLTAYGVMLLAALLAADRFGLGPAGSGLVVAAFGLAGLVSGSPLGHLSDRLGTIRFGAGCMVVLAAGATLIGHAGNVVELIVLVAVSGTCSTGARILVNSLAVTSTPSNRSGATSITLSSLFLGSATAPLVCIPAYHAGHERGLLVAGSGAATAAGLLVLTHWRRRRRQPRPWRSTLAGPAPRPLATQLTANADPVHTPRTNPVRARSATQSAGRAKPGSRAARSGVRRRASPPANQPRRRPTARRPAPDPGI